MKSQTTGQVGLPMLFVFVHFIDFKSEIRLTLDAVLMSTLCQKRTFISSFIIT